MKNIIMGVGKQMELLIFIAASIIGIILILLLRFIMDYIDVEIGIPGMWLLSLVIMLACYIGGLYVFDMITYSKTYELYTNVIVDDDYERLQTIEILLRELIYEINNII